MVSEQVPRHLSLPLAGLTNQAWADVKSRYGLFLAAAAVAILLYIIASVITGLVPYLGEIVLSMFLGVHLSAGLTMLALRVIRNEQATIENLFDSFRCYVPLMLVGLVQGLIAAGTQLAVAGISWIARGGPGDWIAVTLVVVGTVLAIAVSVFFSIRLWLAPIIVMDKKLGTADAIKLSWAWSGPLFWPMFLVGLLALLAFLGSFLLLIVGVLLVGVPFATCMVARMYHRITSGVDPDVCARCGYDLRGVAALRCPECGTPRLPPPTEPITTTI